MRETHLDVAHGNVSVVSGVGGCARHVRPARV